jgi:hypothetical protein
MPEAIQIREIAKLAETLVHDSGEPPSRLTRSLASLLKGGEDIDSSDRHSIDEWCEIR